MNKKYVLVTKILLVFNIILLVYAYPFKYGKTHVKLEKSYVQMELSVKKMAKVSDTLVGDYPDLPERVKKLLLELPLLEKERFDIFCLLSSATSSILNLYYTTSILTVLWIVYSLFHFSRLSKKQ